MPLKKSQLYASLWQSCDQLRGGMDASQYKDYILTLLFVKYVSDKYAGKKYAPIVIPPGGSFADIARLKGQKEIGEKINKAVQALADANRLSGVINLADFDDSAKLGRGQDKVERLSKLVAIFEAIDLRANRAEGDDLLGDAYEYLMRHFAQQSGKSKGQFYTPAEVSRVMARLVLKDKATTVKNTVYDPTCGSGSLLIRVADATPNGLTIYGQEMDNATYALARMNTILHGYTGADIRQGNTLADPQFIGKDGRLMRFDFVVANPPFSQKNWMNGVNVAQDPYDRFRWGTPPAKNGDYAFLLHILASMNPTGRAAVILPHGVLFRGNAEGDIRRALVQQGYIEGIIGLPPNLFFGTGIPACILILDKEGATERREIFFMDASKGFMKDGDKNRLRERDIHKIVDVYLRAAEEPGYARRVPLEEIARNDFNLNIPRYIESAEADDAHDLAAHLRGGIPDRDLDALQRYWRVFPGLRARLFAPLRPGYSHLRVAAEQIRPLIQANPGRQRFEARVMEVWQRWESAARERLTAFRAGDHVKPLVEALAEALLDAFRADAHDATLALIDGYELYQQVKTYCQETLQDDLYLIAEHGWERAARLRPVDVTEENGRLKAREKADLTVGRQGYVADLIPPALLIARYFPDDQRRIEALRTELDDLTARLDSLRDEHGGEDGLLAEALDDGEFSERRIKERLNQLPPLLQGDPLTRAGGPGVRGDDEDADARALLEDCLRLLTREAQTRRALKDAQTRLTEQLGKKYAALTEAEIKTLVVNDKWLAALRAALYAELARVEQTLAARLRALAERYADPLPRIEREVEALRQQAREHLRRMGQAWEEQL